MAESRRKPDQLLMLAVFALIIFGLVMISSAGIIYSQTRFDDQYYFFRHQLIYGVFIGLAVFYLFQKINYQYWKKWVPLFFVASLVCLILVFVPGMGIKTYGASRWLQLGSFSFQPSEVLKLAIILYLAAWLENKGQRKIKDLFEGLIPFLVIIGIVGLLLLKQPDLGTLGVITLTALAIFFVSGGKASHILGLIVLGIAAVGALIKLEPYRFNRFLIFLNPELDPQGIGYHINQALLAVGSGGILGIGLGHSRQKFNYLPEPVGDSIFAIIGEELGLIGAAVLVLLFILLAFRGLKIAKNAPDEFGKLVAVGVTAWVIIQAFINIAAITAIIPLTGVPLPFISYGGTSLVFLMAGAGLLANISKQSNLN